mgnify:CR=1 FL=1
MYRYYFKRGPVGPADFPGRPERICRYNKPEYTRQYERDTWGFAEYDRPIQQVDIDKFHLLEDIGNRLRFVRKG